MKYQSKGNISVKKSSVGPCEVAIEESTKNHRFINDFFKSEINRRFFERFFSVIPGCSPRRSTRDFIADISIPDQYIADISTIFPIFSQYSSHSIICSKSFRGRPISDILAKYRR